MNYDNIIGYFFYRLFTLINEHNPNLPYLQWNDHFNLSNVFERFSLVVQIDTEFKGIEKYIFLIETQSLNNLQILHYKNCVVVRK